ncbi:MAG: DUF4097 domain-containing protein [Defluviitaleaceae bacterium]|nr:DUF4097 domain-containing protein [Defluviitaleaceae bacterium]
MDEKIKILEMLKEGQITVEDSIKLMEAIESPKEEPFFEKHQKEIKKHDGFASKLSELIEDITENVTKAVNEVGIIVDLGEIGNREFVDSKQFIFTANTPEVIESLKLKAKNSQVQIEGYHGSIIEIRGSYKPRIGKIVEIKLLEENNSIELDYDYNAVKHLSIQARIPNLFINEIDAVTSNSKIMIEDIKAKDIYAKTTNGSIITEDVEANLLDLSTSNSSISISDSKSEKAKLATSNGAIKLEDVYITETRAMTSNGKISVESLNPINIEATLDAQTSNASIVVNIEETPAKFRASTSNGKVSVDGGVYNYSENSKSFVEAISPYYEEASKKIKMNLSTSNGNIKIK